MSLPLDLRIAHARPKHHRMLAQTPAARFRTGGVSARPAFAVPRIINTSRHRRLV